MSEHETESDRRDDRAAAEAGEQIPEVGRDESAPMACGGQPL